ncbi:DUF3089 domain-containing protein [Nocardia higoensis]|uniref:DUF3089 domain-containing protein n=1 Tax=Nocardia higoensis TaxID=228599 RepID=UPI00030A1ADE|nr:DUF3089 domain-containing protein [Nocardia higoensis]
MKGVTVPTVPLALPRASRPRGGAAAVLILLAAFLAQFTAPAPASANPSQLDDVVWLCHPRLAADPCRGDLATTERSAGEPDRVVRPKGPRRNAVDCFYVYPTVSQESTYSASLQITQPMRAMAGQQAQRFSRMCDVYAPVYRQRTLLALRTPVPSEQSRAAVEAAFADVAQALGSVPGPPQQRSRRGADRPFPGHEDAAPTTARTHRAGSGGGRPARVGGAGGR